MRTLFRSLGAAAAAVPLLCSAPLAAQTAREPNLIFSINLGVSSGGDLWSVPQQELAAPNALLDTVALDRVLRPNIVASLGATYYRHRNLGYTLEAGYFGLASEMRCAGPARAAFAPDGEEVNWQACSRAQGRHVATSVVGFILGATYRFLPSDQFHPYLRAGAGVGLLGNSYVATSGTVQASSCPTSDNICERVLLPDPEPTEVTWVASLAAGMSIRLSSSYRARMEIRDLVTSVPVALGGSNPTNVNAGPIGKRTVHVPVLTFGFDIVLERQRQRRY